MSSSRRRKPLVTRKVLSDEEDDVNTNDEDSQMTNGTDETDEKAEDIPEDLPEGTVVVEPEAVEDNAFKGPEFPSSKKKVLEATGYLATVYCTACGEQINTSKKGDARRHPELNVLICRRCYKFHTSGEIKQDEDGVDEYCRWCSEGGNLYGCDFCHNAFCQACIKRNLGRAEMSRVKEADKFKCYVCNPKPLAAMVEQCNSVMDQIDRELEKLNDSIKKKKDTEKKTPSSKSEKGKEEKSKSLVVKLSNFKTSTPKPKESPSQVVPKAVPQAQPKMKLTPVTCVSHPTKVNNPGPMTSIIRLPMANPPKPMYNQSMNTSQPQYIYVQPKSAQNPLPSRTTTIPVVKYTSDPINWNNVTEANAAQVMDSLIMSTNQLLSVLRSVRSNVQPSGPQLTQIGRDARRTAINCMKSSVDLFLGQMSQLVGTNITQNNSSKSTPQPIPTAASTPVATATTQIAPKIDNTGSKSSTTEKDSDPIILDSENDDSKMSIVDVSESSDKKESSLKSGKDEEKTSDKSAAVDKDVEMSDKDADRSIIMLDQSEMDDISDIESEEAGDKTSKRSRDKKTETSNTEERSQSRDRKIRTVKTKEKNESADENDEERDSVRKTDESGNENDEKEASDKESEEESSKRKTRRKSSSRRESVDSSKDKKSDKNNEKSKDKTKGKKDGKSEGKKDENLEEKKDEKTEGKEEKTEGKKDEKTDGKKDKKTDGKKDEKTEGKKDENDEGSDVTEENDAAHLELLQELQELSGTVDSKTDSDKDSVKKEKGKGKRGENESKTDGKKKGENESKKDGKKKGENESTADEKKTENKKQEESSSESSESESEENTDSDNSKDADFDVKSTRSSRRAAKKEANVSKFKQLKEKRKEKESSSKKKRRESEKSSKKSKRRLDDSDYDEDLDKEIDKLEKGPVLRKGKKRDNDKEEKEKTKKDKIKGEKSKKERKAKKKGEDFEDLSSDGDNDVDDDEEEDQEDDKDEPMDQDDDATEDLTDKDDDEDPDIVEDSSDSEIVLSPRKKREKAESKSKKKGKTESDSATEDEDAPKKKKLRSSLLDAKLSDSESDFQPAKKASKGKKRKAGSSEEKSEDSSETEDEFIPLGKKSKDKKGKSKKKKDGTGKKRRKRIKKTSSSEGEDDEEDETEAESDEEGVKKKKKRRKKKGSDDSEEEKNSDDEDGSPSKGGRKAIRKLIKNKKLTDETKAAARAEEERRVRIAEKQKKYNNVVQVVDESSPTKAPITKQLILERDEKTKEPILEVDHELVTKLKPHQVEAVEFLWNCTVESLKMLKEDKDEGAGCILAHCMGLGKTLSVITFLHTMLGNYELTGFSTALIVCPLNTVLNWQNEVSIWIGENEVTLEVYELASVKMNETRGRMLEEWHENGGIMILGYEMFRNLSQGNNCRSKKLKASFKKTLLDPGPEFVVCDEGHVLKNDASALSKAMMEIKTKRRIVLTGTPLQNNLSEYHCMVNFVKPNLLGTRKEFGNRFVNPIVNGQCTDSSAHDVRLMKRRAHILHEKLAGCVQRKDYSALTKYLPPKHEYVIAVRMSNTQCDLYNKYLDLGGYMVAGEMVKSKGAKLFSDYQALMRIWTHPWVLKMDEIRQEMKNLIDDDDSFIEDTDTPESEAQSSNSGSESDKSSILQSSGDDEKKKKKDKEEAPKESFAGEIVKKWKTRSRGEFGEGDFADMDSVDQPFTREWWGDYVTEEDQFKMELSGKLSLLFEILRMCEEIGDKVLVFSQSLLSLDILEAYLEHIDSVHNDALLNKKDDKEEDKGKKEEDKEKKEEDKGKKDEDKDKDGEKKKEEDKPVEEHFGKTWMKGQDYLRMDGSTGAPQRSEMAKNFNDPDNYRLRLFLISTKAGGLGINLVAANRVIIFDASWNPSHDVQSIFRVYRFGQEKPVYVYRFLAQGTMEEKIYERQVTKQSLSQRVIDEHQIDRHFNSNDLRELYKFSPDRLDDPNRKERPTPALPKDTLLAELLTEKKQWIVGYHEHDSLLENKIDQELSEEERKAAWEEFENERKGLINTVQQRFNMAGMPGFPSHLAFTGGPGMNMNNMMTQLNQDNLLRIVQEMRQKFPHLPQEQLTMQVQNVIRNMISRQIQQQQWEQRRQLEQRELQHHQQLQQIQARIMMQQNQLRQQQNMEGRAGSSSMLANALMNGKPPNKS